MMNDNDFDGVDALLEELLDNVRDLNEINEEMKENLLSLQEAKEGLVRACGIYSDVDGIRHRVLLCDTILRVQSVCLDENGDEAEILSEASLPIADAFLVLSRGNNK